MRTARFALAAVFVLALSACGDKASGPPQQLNVSATDTALNLTGADALHAGLVTITVENAGKGAHALLISRLKKDMTEKDIIAALDDNKIQTIQASFEAKGGIPDVPPGKSWEETVNLEPGKYVLADYGYNGTLNYHHGLIKTIEVASGGHQAAPPKTIGKIEMKDFAFVLSLPQPFHGKGVIEIPNTGGQPHELSLVRTPPQRGTADVLAMIHSGPVEAPPGFSIHKVLALLDPGNTAYVRFDLPPGHYVAVCAIVDPKQKKLHADLGQTAEFDVR